MQTSLRAIAKRADILGSHADASITEEPGAGKLHAGICAGCALKACEVPSPEMATAAKLSSQPRTESCVMAGNGHCEA